MGLFTRLKNTFLYGRNRNLRAYEKTSLESFQQKLSPEQQRLFLIQLGGIDNIQRFSNDKMVHFSFWEDSKIPRFTNDGEEVVVGRVTLTANSNKIKGDIVLHHGQLSSLEFDKPPKEDLAYNVTTVEIIEDLSKRKPEEPSVISFGPVLNELSKNFEITEIVPPVSPSELRKFLLRVSAEIPEDYTQILMETNGFRIEGWRVLGTNTRKIVREDDNLHILAEHDPRSLCLQENAKEPMVCFYDQIDDDLKRLGKSFLKALVDTIKVSSNGRGITRDSSRSTTDL